MSDPTRHDSRYWQFDRNIAESVITVHLDPLRSVADSER